MTGCDRVFEVMAEHKWRPAGNHAAGTQDLQVDIKSDLAEGDHHFDVRQKVEFALEKRTAVPQLFRRRLVVRRGAMRGGRDVDVFERQPVVAGYARRLRCK